MKSRFEGVAAGLVTLTIVIVKVPVREFSQPAGGAADGTIRPVTAAWAVAGLIRASAITLRKASVERIAERQTWTLLSDRDC